MFINTQEMLLVQGAEGRFYETDPSAITYATAADVEAEFRDDEFTKFIRFDTSNLKGEDVTEQVAQAYLARVQKEYGYLDGDTAPDYVSSSDAWSVYLEGIEETIDPVREYGTYHVHNGSVI